MRKNRNTTSNILRFLIPGCKFLGLSFNTSNPKVAEADASVLVCNEDPDSASSFGVW